MENQKNNRETEGVLGRREEEGLAIRGKRREEDSKKEEREYEEGRSGKK